MLTFTPAVKCVMFDNISDHDMGVWSVVENHWLLCAHNTATSSFPMNSTHSPPHLSLPWHSPGQECSLWPPFVASLLAYEEKPVLEKSLTFIGMPNGQLCQSHQIAFRGRGASKKWWKLWSGKTAVLLPDPFPCSCLLHFCSAHPAVSPSLLLFASTVSPAAFVLACS